MTFTIVETSYRTLYPEREWASSETVKYSRALKNHNASITRKNNHYTLKLSTLWKTVDRDIIIGLVQELLGKLHKERKLTINIQLYHSYLKHLATYVPKTEPPLLLKESFQRVNTTYFSGMLDQPNIKWCTGKNRVGYYEYTTDTVALSKELESEAHILDYVMYHELLHKKHKFTTTKTRTRHHTRAFRTDEKKYAGWKRAEEQLQHLARRNKWSWF